MLKDFGFRELKKSMDLMGNRKWPFYITILICSICVGTFSNINSFMYKNVINGVVYGRKELLNNAVILTLISLALACIVNPIAAYVCAYLSKGAIFELRSKLFLHALRLPRAYYDRNHSGDILSRMTNDVSRIDEIYDGKLYNVIFHFLVGASSIVMILSLNWILGLIMIALGIITTIAHAAFAKPIREMSDRLQNNIGRVTQRFLDIVAGIRVIKLYNINDDVAGNFKKENDNVIREGMNITRKDAQKSSVNSLLSFLTFFGILVPGVFMVYHKMTDMGTVIAILTLKMNAFCLFEELGGFIVELQKSIAGSKRVFELLDEPEEPQKSSSYFEINSKDAEKSGVIFKNVEFGYDDNRIMKDFNIEFRENEVTAIVGLSGSGKSTIIKLLSGLYTPNGGRILLKGSRNCEIGLEELRERIAYVSQNAFLFSGSIEENIGYGNSKASREEIIECAKLANAHDFIINLPKGYDTRIGEGGSGLSGGQRQRIAIARALLKSAPILLLDEATSSLDSESEILVQEAINKVMKGRTTIIIAHRLSTIKNADKIYVIQDGKIAEEGTHSSLMEGNGIYKMLYQS